jgi:YD repeat-containing protein
VRRSETLVGDDLWDVVETKYDKLSRVWKQTRPFRDGTPENQWKWAENFYDALDRVTQSEAAAGSLTLAEYNASARPQGASAAPGKTVKVTDPWGRERWGRTNSDGKFVELIEPKPDGTVAVGGLVTTYKYDTLGNMTEVQQGAQHRLFQYDSMSRLTRQKMAEADATLDDAGNLSSTDGKWSEAVTYDERSNIVARVDARGVKAIYTFTSGGAPDPLNRLLSIEYDASAATGVLPAPKVSFGYETAGDVTRLRSITTEGVSVEEFTYDAEARLQERS